MQRNPTYGLVLVVISAVLFIINSGVSRASLWNGIDAGSLTSVRITGTFVVLLVVAVIAERSALEVPRGRVLVMFVMLGVVGIALLQWLYFIAIDRIPLGLALLLEYTAPLLVALFARFVQHQQVKRRMWIGLGLALVGLATATQIWSGLSFDSIGVAAGLGAAVCFATYFLIGEEGVATISPMRVALWGFGIAALAINLFAPVTAVFDQLGDDASLHGRLADLHLPLWVLLGWVVLMGTLAPFTLELVALRHIPATTATTFSMLEPVGAFVIGWAWYGEDLGPVTVLGCGLVVIGIILAQTSRRTSIYDPVLT